MIASRAKKLGTQPSLIVQFAVCAGLIALVWIVFGQTLGHDFVNYDDKVYVYGNPLVSSGFSWPHAARAFVDKYTNNWHPLTLISHMIDCQLFGLQPAGHHFTNVLLHSIATIQLFLWLRNLTGRFWSCAFVAALFAVHPLRVESVAWIAERKDVLSAVFFFLTLIAYARYARAPALGRYLLTSILFACGLMSKPMLVTVPAVLLLLDYWPLNRVTDTKSFWKLFREKIPLFALSAGASAAAVALQVHASNSVGQLPLLWRVENALVSYVIYIWKFVWPHDLAVFYPHPDDRLPLWQVILAATFLAVITLIVWKLRRTRPYLLVGWLWYLVMLLPVIGVVEVGLQGHADRYTYLPQVGLCLMVVWGISDLLKTFNAQQSTPNDQLKTLDSTLGVGRWALGVFCCAIVGALALCAHAQVSYWRNSETLWTRALAVTKDNDVALTNLGTLYADRGQFDRALSYFERALAIRSSSEHRHYSMSLALIQNSIGNALARQGRLAQATAHLREAVQLRPDYPDGHYNLGTALFQQGDLDGAIAEWRTMLSMRPDDAGVHTSLGNALAQKGLLSEAADHYEKALQSDPDSVLALNNLAWVMSTGPDDSLRNNEIALKLALKANQLSQENNPVFIRTLAAAYAQAGAFDKALQIAKRAAEEANAQGVRDLANEIAHDVDLYQRGQPLRDSNLRNAR
ncbi:MAG TPA: tetratricopeptide repeat protein [Chthoniobacterales bacterium]|jgi:tetratricopeptide (TPR) repeat protein|nr:tetratricopeptide repeat protein [Chthoniobacterales bacterium]